MDGIAIVAFVVRCTTGLLLCDAVPTAHLHFMDIEDCRRTASKLIAARQDADKSGIWMADCRYRLTPPPRHTRPAPGAYGLSFAATPRISR